MPTHPSIQFLRWSPRSGAQLFAGSVAAALVALSFFAGMEVSVATARMAAEPSGQIVNRLQKGDRLLGSAAQQNVAKKPREFTVPRLDLKLPDGCDSLVSPIADDRLARIASRCVS
jgi:hypothetical protein